MIFVLSSISNGLEFGSVSHTSIWDNSESNIFNNIKFSSEIFNNWPNWPNTTSVVTKQCTFSKFSFFFVILRLVLASNLIVSGVKNSR